MSNFTTQLRCICESLAQQHSSDPNILNYGLNTVIGIARPYIFDFSYPKLADWQEAESIETDIIKKFYFREIGYETFGRWKLALECKMHDIMPYYNALIESAKESYNIILPEVEREITNQSGSEDKSLSATESNKTTGNKNYTEAENKDGSRKNDVTDAQVSANTNDSQTTLTATESTDSNTSNARDGKNVTVSDNTSKQYSSDTPQNSINDPLDYMSAYGMGTVNQTETETTSSSETGISAETKNNTERSTVEQNTAITSNRESAYNETYNDNTGRTSDSVEETSNTGSKDSSELSVSTGNTTRELYSTGGKTPAEMVQLYRTTLLKIHEMIEREISPLFIGLWSA